MPVVPSSNYSTGADVLALVQDLCNDTQGQLYNAQYCIQAINYGGRIVARELKNQGKMTLIEDEWLVTIPAVLSNDPAQQVYLTFTGITGNVTPAPSPYLPEDLLEPIKLWERISGEGRLRDMRNRTADGGLPKRWQGGSLVDWEWRTDQICFIGATQDCDVIVRYTVSALEFTIDNNGNISGSLGDLDAIDAVAYYAAAALLPKVGGLALSQQYEAKAKELVEQLTTSTARNEQMSPVRMRPYGGRGRGRGLRSY